MGTASSKSNCLRSINFVRSRHAVQLLRNLRQLVGRLDGGHCGYEGRLVEYQKDSVKFFRVAKGY